MQYQFNDEKHLHTLGGKPLTGTSSVVDVLAKPLSWWASGKACEVFGWTHPKENEKEIRLQKAGEVLEIIKGMDGESYLSLIDKAYCNHSQHLKKSAKKGTDLHAELEKYVKWKMGKSERLLEQFDPKINPFIEWADKNVKQFLVSEGHCYSERLWVGGIVDCVAELNDGTLAVIDFKSSKEAYTGQFIQTAGYCLELEENGVCDQTGKHCKKLDKKISALVVVPFGGNPVLPVIQRDVEAYKKAFESAVVLYRLIFNHNE